MAHLLEIMVRFNSDGTKLMGKDIENVMVIVTRWYGGIMLHGDRFKHISNAGREALQVGGFLRQQGGSSRKGIPKKSKKKS